MRVSVLNPMTILKGHGVYTFHPSGPAFLRNPPPQSFRPMDEPDIPAFAHDGQGNHDEGEFVLGRHGEHVYQTGRGEFRHGIDAVINRIGEFLKQRGDPTKPKAVVEKAIELFNENHALPEKHYLPNTDSNQWRKIRLAPLQRGIGNDTPTKTVNGTLITHLHNKNPETAPLGKFLESAYMPIYRELFHVLTRIMGFEASDVKSLNFTKYPYVYAHDLADNTYGTHEDHPDEQIPDKYRRQAPEGYFPDLSKIHSWEVVHQLPKVMHYPKIGKKGAKPVQLKALAHQHIEEALQMPGGLEHVPDVQIQINLGSHLKPDYTQVNLRDALADAGLRERLIDDVSNAPSLMFLFGRAGQGDTKDLMNYFEDKYGMVDDGLTYDQHQQYVTSGKGSQGQGTHTNAARFYALARKSGAAGEDGRSVLGEHEITPEELQIMGLPHSEMAMKHADRYQTIVEALADHQATARGHQVRLGVGDIPDSPMKGATIVNYPQYNPETGEMTSEGLQAHMDAFTHRIEDYAPTSPSEVSTAGVRPGLDAVAKPDAVPVEEQLPPPEHVAATEPSSLGTSPPVGPPSPIPKPPVAVTPKPLSQPFTQAREAVRGFNPAQVQEFLQHANIKLPTHTSPKQFQQVYGDPHQTRIEQWLKSKDTHLPIMDRVLKQLEELQMTDAREDSEIQKHIKPHFRDSRLLAKHLNLTREDVHSISYSTGDWYRIAKTYNVEPKVVKVIKVNTGDVVV